MKTDEDLQLDQELSCTGRLLSQRTIILESTMEVRVSLVSLLTRSFNKHGSRITICKQL